MNFKCFKKDTITEVRIAFGAVAPTVVRSKKFEQRLTGLKPGELCGSIEEMLSLYAALINPVDDQRSSAHYRRETCLALLRDFLDRDLTQALDNLSEGS